MITFMLIAVFSIFLEDRNLVKGLIVVFITLFAFFDFEKALGIPFFAGKFLLVYYISKFAVLAVAESSNFLKRRLIFISEMQFYASFIISAVFLRG